MIQLTVGEFLEVISNDDAIVNMYDSDNQIDERTTLEDLWNDRTEYPWNDAEIQYCQVVSGNELDVAAKLRDGDF